MQSALHPSNLMHLTGSFDRTGFVATTKAPGLKTGLSNQVRVGKGIKLT
jgi:hypothetical protein